MGKHGRRGWRESYEAFTTLQPGLTSEQIEAQRAAVEITEEVSDYTLRGNPEAKTTLPADYVPTVFEEDAEMWARINAELKDGE